MPIKPVPLPESLQNLLRAVNAVVDHASKLEEGVFTDRKGRDIIRAHLAHISELEIQVSQAHRSLTAACVDR